MIDGAPASDLRRSWEDSRLRFPKGTLHMRISDDHDEARAVARYGLRGALAASALMFTLDGVPLLYNGMEAGDATESGDPALFEKLTIFWHPKERPPLRRIYHDLIRLRKQYAALRNSQRGLAAQLGRRRSSSPSCALMARMSSSSSSIFPIGPLTGR